MGLQSKICVFIKDGDIGDWKKACRVQGYFVQWVIYEG